MKKFLALSLTAALLLAMLGACTAADPVNTNSPDPTAGASAAVSPTDSTQEPSLSLPSEEPTAAPPVTDPPPTDPPVTDPPATDPPATNPPATNPPVTNPPATNPPATNPPATNPPVTNPPATNPPATNPPATNPPATNPPATNPPATNPPESDPPESDSPEPERTPPPFFPGGVGGIGGLGGGGTTNPGQGSDSEILEPTNPTASDVNLRDFFNDLIDGESYAFPSMEEAPTSEWISSYIPGLVSIPSVQRLVFIPMATSNGVEIVLVQVTNSSDVAAVRSALQAHIDYKASNFDYPQVMEAWQRYARIASNGNYVMLIVHEQHDAIIADFNALFSK